MQVVKENDFITHALIGGAAKTIEFGISNDAAFFHILSSTLYSDQRLAVAREVLCNAWDAHIRAGKTGIAVVVLITEEKVIVRDFASGIHPDMMGPLYGTYGGSDKKNNGTETGGFGLGCKSPFAYGDHFEVISWHEGVKTIYNLSKSSADKNGKPGITPIVSLPTTESGLQVTIPLKSPKDKENFISLFKRIAFNGEMNVVINTDTIGGLPLSNAEHNWVITSENIVDTNHRVFIRYGNVIYPVENNIAFKQEFMNLENFLGRLNSKSWYNTYKIIFQAEPDTISVTPSRESLSMQEHTIGTLKTLLKSFFIKDFDKIIAKESWNLLDKVILKVTEEKKIGKLMQANKKLPRHNPDEQDKAFISNTADLADQYTRKTYPNYPEFYNRDMSLRIEMATLLEAGKRGHLNQVKHQIITPENKRGKLVTDKHGTHREHVKPHEWFKRTILRPLARDIAAHPMLQLKHLNIVIGISSWRGDNNFCAPDKYHKRAIGEYLPIMRNILVISHSKKDLNARIRSAPELKNMGEHTDIWFYHAPVAKTRIQATRDFFNAKGFKVIDLTVDQTYDLPKPVKALVPKVVKPKLTGYPMLKGCIALAKQTRVDNCFLEGVPRVAKPLFYHSITYSRAEHRVFAFEPFDTQMAYKIIHLFGDQCAVVRTDAQVQKFKKEGLMELTEYVMSYVTKCITTSPSFIAYWAEDLNRALGNKTGEPNLEHESMNALLDIEEIRKSIGLKQSLNEHDLMVLSLWRGMVGKSRHYASYAVSKLTYIDDAAKLIEAMPVDKTILDVVAKQHNNDFVDVLHLGHFKRIARSPTAKADGHLDRLAKLVKIALLG